MTHRKFFSGDCVQVTSHFYGRHFGHIGEVTSTKIKVGPGDYQRVTYIVACECGVALKPTASYVDKWRGPFPGIDKARSQYFLRKIGVAPGSNPIMQVDERISLLKEREGEILLNRFGLHGRKGRTLSELAKEYGVTRERIRQIETRALEKIHGATR
jgi:hypothetical protein